MKRRLCGSAALVGAMGLVAFSNSPDLNRITVSHAPMVRAKPPNTTGGHGHGGSGGSSSYGWTSSNWSGYALSSGVYNDITGTWSVPSVQSTSKGVYSSTWIGIDGFNNSNLIQTGTEQDSSNGGTQYYAWWEILPAPETKITTTDSGTPATVQPGDNMSAHIHSNGNGSWTIQIQNTTENWTFTTTQTYSGPATSAEWIEEAPTIGGHVATLANYGEVTLDPGTVNGKNPGLVVSEDGAMVQSRVVVSAPSAPDKDTDGFSAAYGSTAPQPPTS